MSRRRAGDPPPGPTGAPPAGPAGAPGPALDVVQSWFQAVVTHPAGVAAGAAAPAARDLVRMDRGELETLVRRSSRLTAEERLSIYANAYYARLLECLGDGFPVLKQVLGAETFDRFAFEYLQTYPSRSYTLDRLAESFPRFLAETRPAPAAATPDWPDFLIDLATFEWTLAKVFDGPGAEGDPLLSPDDLAAFTPARFAAARLETVPCLRLLTLRFPLNAFYTAARAATAPAPAAADPEPAATATAPAAADSEPAATGRTPAAADAPGPSPAGAASGTGDAPLPFPEPATAHLALSRRDYIVRRHPLTAFEHALLTALAAGATVTDALAAAIPAALPAAGATAATAPADAELAAQIGAAFRRFTAAGFFRAITR